MALEQQDKSKDKARDSLMSTYTTEPLHSANHVPSQTPKCPENPGHLVEKRSRGRPRKHMLRDANDKPIIERDENGDRIVPVQKYVQKNRSKGSQTERPAAERNSKVGESQSAKANRKNAAGVCAAPFAAEKPTRLAKRKGEEAGRQTAAKKRKRVTFADDMDEEEAEPELNDEVKESDDDESDSDLDGEYEELEEEDFDLPQSQDSDREASDAEGEDDDEPVCLNKSPQPGRVAAETLLCSSTALPNDEWDSALRRGSNGKLYADTTQENSFPTETIYGLEPTSFFEEQNLAVQPVEPIVPWRPDEEEEVAVFPALRAGPGLFQSDFILEFEEYIELRNRES